MNTLTQEQLNDFNFVRSNANIIDWYYISEHQKLSENFIREFKDEIDWFCISKYQNLSESLIREFKNEVDWRSIPIYQKLSENFIREFKNKLDLMERISKYQKLSENFIREFKDKVNWKFISKYQKLSEEFIEEFKYRLHTSIVEKYQKLSNPPQEIIESKDNWLYKTNEYKKNKVLESGIYEMEGDYIIAYKSTMLDGHSVFNFQYRYEVGESYKSHADFNIDEKNSFGLSAWTQAEALKYYSLGKLFKVKIHLNDLAALIHGPNKLRATKISILEEVDFFYD